MESRHDFHEEYPVKKTVRSGSAASAPFVFILLMSVAFASCGGGGGSGGGTTSAIPVPSGIYVLNENSNEQSTATAYAAGLAASPAYQNDITGHAIFVPIAKILPSITTWGTFPWDWTYLDMLVQIAVSNGKKFSVELEIGYQSSGTYLQSLPTGFAAACGADCAPLIDVWTTG